MEGAYLVSAAEVAAAKIEAVEVASLVSAAEVAAAKTEAVEVASFVSAADVAAAKTEAVEGRLTYRLSRKYSPSMIYTTPRTTSRSSHSKSVDMVVGPI